ncbi:fungal-specific transcription factor domain-containing protein [Tricladium varicosporioides]|nr:fungal-specific transcription factor domain-containing protein [Hymenoscyphus varicosporioides]
MTTEKQASIEPHGGSDSQSPASENSSSNKKRPSTSAGLDKDGNPKPVKRRAAKACAACRARKVRCDVMQRYHITADGEVTCSNCTMDGIKCVIEESKRRKKHLSTGQPLPGAPVPQTTANGATQAWRNGLVNPSDISNPEARRWSGSTAMSNDLAEMGHVPHQIYQNVNSQISKGEMLRRQSFIQTPFETEPNIVMNLLSSASMSGDRTSTRLESPIPPPPMLKHKLPEYLKPLPQRMTSVDIDYLFAKGALSLPEPLVRNALLRSYLEYVHPYMPLIEAYEALQIIADGTGASGRMSLLLFQAIMFAGTAFVDMDMLRRAGYSNRKAARKAFFQKARVLYDFDYEVDRVSLVQSLLLMTYWYETPDDQKDTWHWMGVAISLAHTIGLHRNPEKSNMEPNKKKLWKRIWWSCFMRDRLVALGMRRPTRVKDEDYDVPMLTEDDFEIEMLPEGNPIIPDDCTLVRDTEAQRHLAQMCIAKAKLCLCISHVLSAQYSVLVRHQGMQGQEGSTRSSVMLFPKKLDQTDEVRCCDVELNQWIAELPEACMYTTDLAPGNSGAPLFVQRSLLHMVYFTTLSALHRPQVLPAAPTAQQDSSRGLQDLSRKKVREASREITRISQNLHSRGLEKYLPTTGVTVLLPAIIIHLLDIKSCNDEARQAAMDGFCQCMLVLEKLRDNYSSADFATQFLEAAIRKADIDVVMSSSREKIRHEDVQAALGSDRVKELLQRSRANRRTPPPSGEDAAVQPDTQSSSMMDISIPAFRQQDQVHNAISARTPPETDSNFVAPSQDQHQNHNTGFAHMTTAEFNAVYPTNEVDLNDFLNFDTGNEMWNVPLEEGAHGESGGFMGDMNWLDHPPGWSRLNSPQPGIDGSDIFGMNDNKGMGGVEVMG